MKRYRSSLLMLFVLLAAITVLVGAGKNQLQQQVDALEAEVAELRADSDRQPVVVDANGDVLGDLVAPHDSVAWNQIYGIGTVLLHVSGAPLLPVHLRREHLVGTVETIFFASSDCSGAPLFRFSAPEPFLPILPATFVLGQGETIFYSDVDAEPSRELTVGSELRYPEQCVATQSGAFMVLGFRRTSDPFTPPFEVVTRGDLVQ
jgi:hypothetical protein